MEAPSGRAYNNVHAFVEYANVLAGGLATYAEVKLDVQVIAERSGHFADLLGEFACGSHHQGLAPVDGCIDRL